MITPIIHRVLRREDFARLIAEIAHADPHEGQEAAERFEHGDVDGLLDAPAALDAVRGRGGAPAALPLALLWYVPVRAALKKQGEPDVELADLAATLPIAFLRTRAGGGVAHGVAGLAAWQESMEALPRGTMAQAERAAYCAALALWWAGCFPEWVTRRGHGPGMKRAYVGFSAQAFALASRLLSRMVPALASLYRRAGERGELLCRALNEARADYLGRDAHTAEGRLKRYLENLEPGT